VTLTVFTYEHPTFTRTKSRFNDTWFYALTGVAGVVPASGSVNDSHYTRGTLTRRHCIKVGDQTAASPFTFEGTLAATNVGDSALSTSVAMEVKLTCTPDLKVVSANLGSPNSKGHHVIKPGKGNVPGHYISIPS